MSVTLVYKGMVLFLLISLQIQIERAPIFATFIGRKRKKIIIKKGWSVRSISFPKVEL